MREFDPAQDSVFITFNATHTMLENATIVGVTAMVTFKQDSALDCALHFKRTADARFYRDADQPQWILYEGKKLVDSYDEFPLEELVRIVEKYSDPLVAFLVADLLLPKVEELMGEILARWRGLKSQAKRRSFKFGLVGMAGKYNCVAYEAPES